MIKNQESQTQLVNWELTTSIAWAWGSDYVTTCTLESISSLEMNVYQH